MTNSHDVVIVGAGPVGAAAARELSRVGRRVLLIDPGSKPGEAWRASAGMLAPQIETREDTPLFELGVAGREYYRDRAAELADETGINIGLVESGILRLAVTEADDSLLRSAVAWQRQHGHEPTGSTRTKCAASFPGLVATGARSGHPRTAPSIRSDWSKHSEPAPSGRAHGSLLTQSRH